MHTNAYPSAHKLTFILKKYIPTVPRYTFTHPCLHSCTHACIQTYCTCIRSYGVVLEFIVYFVYWKYVLEFYITTNITNYVIFLHIIIWPLKTLKSSFLVQILPLKMPRAFYNLARSDEIHK